MKVLGPSDLTEIAEELRKKKKKKKKTNNIGP